jgi:hypothetical protein
MSLRSIDIPIGGPRSVLASAALLLAFSIFYPITAQVVYTYGADSAEYIGLAASLIEGDGYRFGGRLGSRFPPGFPVLLAPVAWLADRSFVALSRYTAIFGILGLLVTLAYFRLRREPPSLAFSLLLGTSVSYYSAATSGPMSDVPYLVLSFGFLAWMEYTQQPDPAVSNLPGVASASILLLLTLACRTIGVALLAGLGLTLLHQLARARPRAIDRRAMLQAAVGLTIGALFFAGWWWWTAAHREPYLSSAAEHPYWRQLLSNDPRLGDSGRASMAAVLLRTLENAPIQLAHASEILTNLPWLKPSWFSPFILAAAALLLIGWRAELRRSNPLAGWYFLAYMGIILIWPFDEGTRYLVPVTPLLFFFTASGIRIVYGWARGPGAELFFKCTLVLAGVAAVGCWQIAGSSRQDLAALIFWLAVIPIAVMVPRLRARSTPRLHSLLRRGFVALYMIGFVALGLIRAFPLAVSHLDVDRQIRREPLRRATTWLMTNTSPQAVIVTGGRAPVHYVSGRQTIPLPLTANVELYRELFSRYRPDFVIIEDPLEFEYYHPTQPERFAIMAREFPGRLDLVYDFPGVKVYRFLAEDGAATRPSEPQPTTIGTNGAFDRKP